MSEPLKRPLEDLLAADQFRESLIARADAFDGLAPLWYGWAVFDAFLAGLDYARDEARNPRIPAATPDADRPTTEKREPNADCAVRGEGGAE